jgi:hypothetical protein
VAHRVEQLRQEVGIHSSVITPSLFSRGEAEATSGYFMIRLAISTAPVAAEALRKALLVIPRFLPFSLFKLLIINPVKLAYYAIKRPR